MTDTMTEGPDGEIPAIEAPEAEHVSFWNRPMVDRYLVPLVLPIAVVVGLVTYIVNISRLFLSGHGAAPVVLGTSILLVILFGAALVSSAAPRLRSGTLALCAVGFVGLIIGSGWLTVGHAENKEAGVATLPTDLATNQDFETLAAPGGEFAFDPNELELETGIAKVTIDIGAPGHTFAFVDPDTKLGVLDLQQPGPGEGVAFFAEPGEYEFICTVPGHAAAGMRGVLKVTGETKTLDQALEEAGNPPAAG